MKDKKEKHQDPNSLDENDCENNPPAEFIDRVSRESKSVALSEKDKKVKSKSDERLEKFKRGELGAAHNRYNDDGDQSGASRKLDIDTKSDLKQWNEGILDIRKAVNAVRTIY